MDADSTVDAEKSGPRPARRSLVALGALAAGFWVARAAPGVSAVAWFAVCCGVLCAAMLVRGRGCRVAMAGAMVAFGAGWMSMRVLSARADGLGAVVAGMAEGDGSRAADGAELGGSGVMVTVEGMLVEDPSPVGPARGALARFARGATGTRGRVAVESVETATGPVRAGGRVYVTVGGAGDDALARMRAGDRVRLTGVLRPIEGPMNPGEYDRRLWAAQDGIEGRLSVPGPALVSAPPSRPPPGRRAGLVGRAAGAWHRVVADLRKRTRGALELAAPVAGDEEAGGAPERERAQGRALLSAMLLGEREPGLDDVDAAFRRLGLVHLVAISGFNLAAVAWLAMLLVRLTGDRGWAEMAVALLAVGAYLLVVPAEAPVARAGLMLLVFMVAEATGRRYDRVTVLGWIAVGLLLWRPMDLWSLGFQLSFGVVAALLLLGRRAQERLFGVELRGTVQVVGERAVWWMVFRRDAGRFVKGAIASSVLAWAVATPVIMHHTGMVSPLAPIVSLVVMPVVFVVLSVGYVVLMAGALFPSAAAVSGGVLAWLGGTLVRLVTALDGLPGMSVRLPAISAAWSAGATVLVAYWFARGHRRDWRAWAATVLMGAWLAVQLVGATRLPQGTVLRIDTLAVGDGTCHLVRNGGEAMLWDCGSSRPAAGLREIPDAVRALGAWRVPTVVVTHPNLDHFAALLDVVEPLGVTRVVVTRRFVDDGARAPGSAPGVLLEGLHGRGVEVVVKGAGDELALGVAGVRLLSPPEALLRAEANDTSLVGLFTVGTGAGARRLLLTGDVADAAIGGLLKKPEEARAEVMEVPHHGSARAAAVRFVRAVDPKVVLQSTGPGRVGDARWAELRGTREWRTTAMDGAAWAEIGRDGSVVSGALRKNGE